MRDGKRNDLTLLSYRDPNPFVAGNRRRGFVSAQQGYRQLRHSAVGEEHVAQHIHVETVATEDVGEREHGVTRDRICTWRHRIHDNGQETRTRPAECILDRVDQPVTSGNRGRRHPHEIIDDLRDDRLAIRNHADHRERTPVRIGVIGQHLHGNCATRTNPHLVLHRDRVAHTLELRAKTDPDRSGGPRTERVHHRVGEAVRARRISASLVIDVIRSDRRDGTLLRIGLLAEKLHGVAIRVSAGQRDLNPHDPGGKHTRRHGRGHRRVVGLEDGLPNGDPQIGLRDLAIRPRDLVGCDEVTGVGGGQVAQDVARGEQEPGVATERGRQLRIECQVSAVRLGIVGEDRNVDRVADAYRYRVICRDRRLETRRPRYLDHCDNAVRFGQAIADSVVEDDRADVQRRGQRYPDSALLKHLGAHARVARDGGHPGHHEHPAGRVDIGRCDINGLAAEGLHEHCLRNGDRLGIDVGGHNDVNPHHTRYRLFTIVDDIVEIVRSYLVAGEAECPRLKTRCDR